MSFMLLLNYILNFLYTQKKTRSTVALNSRSWNLISSHTNIPILILQCPISLPHVTRRSQSNLFSSIRIKCFYLSTDMDELFNWKSVQNTGYTIPIYDPPCGNHFFCKRIPNRAAHRCNVTPKKRAIERCTRSLSR